MKSQLIIGILLVLIVACSVTIKENVTLRRMNLQGQVESIEEFTATVEKKMTEDIDSLAYATTYFVRFNRRGEKIEEISFSDLGEMKQKTLYNYAPKGQLIETKIYNQEGIQEMIEYNYEDENLFEIIKKDENQIIVEQTKFETDSLQIVYENGMKRKQIIIQTSDDGGKKKRIEDDQTKIITEQQFDKQGRLIKEIQYDADEKILFQKNWQYGANDEWIGYDEFSAKGYKKRIERHFDEHDEIIKQVVKIPRFQPEIDEINWNKKYSIQENLHFDPANYKLITAETNTFSYERDDTGNWVMQKRFVNQKLTEIKKRDIHYY